MLPIVMNLLMQTQNYGMRRRVHVHVATSVTASAACVPTKHGSLRTVTLAAVDSCTSRLNSIGTVPCHILLVTVVVDIVLAMAGSLSSDKN